MSFEDVFYQGVGVNTDLKELSRLSMSESNRVVLFGLLDHVKLYTSPMNAGTMGPEVLLVTFWWLSKLWSLFGYPEY